MVHSERYVGGLRKLERDNKGVGLDVSVELVREHFERALPRLPEGLASELYLRYLDHFTRTGFPDAAFFEEAKYLVPYIDLFRGEYDPAAAPLPDGEWDFLRAVVNGYAGDLDLDLVTSIMQLVMDRGRL